MKYDLVHKVAEEKLEETDQAELEELKKKAMQVMEGFQGLEIGSICLVIVLLQLSLNDAMFHCNSKPDRSNVIDFLEKQNKNFN